MDKVESMILDEIVADKRGRLMEQKKQVSLLEMEKWARESKRKNHSFYGALSKNGLSIIGEFKKASPSMGVISNPISLTDRIDQYNISVDAISVLTEEDHFNGSVKYLEEIRNISHLPLLRKDFIIEEYQIYEAKVIGADAVLLIAAILNDEQMRKFYRLTKELGMDALVEVHNEVEMARALDLGVDIVGVNNRDLRDFTIRLETVKRLSDYMSANLDKWKADQWESNIQAKRPLLVSESGVSKDEDILFLRKAQVDALLIGTAFMESENPKKLAVHWKELFEKNESKIS